MQEKTSICQPLNQSNLLFRCKRAVLGLFFAKRYIFSNLPSLAPVNEFKEFITFYLYRYTWLIVHTEIELFTFIFTHPLKEMASICQTLN